MTGTDFDSVAETGEKWLSDEIRSGNVTKIRRAAYGPLDAAQRTPSADVARVVTACAGASSSLAQRTRERLALPNFLRCAPAREDSPNTAFVQGVRKFAMDVRELDIDLIDRINPFGEAYAILAKTMSEDSLKQVTAIIAAKRVKLTPEEARELAKRALKFKQKRGRLPSITSQDAWERRMAEGVAFLARKAAEAANV